MSLGCWGEVAVPRKGCYPERAHHLYYQRKHKQKRGLSSKNLILGVWGERLRHLPKVIKNTVGGPPPWVWVKQDLSLFPWTMSFYTGMIGPCDTNHFKAARWYEKNRDILQPVPTRVAILVLEYQILPHCLISGPCLSSSDAHGPLGLLSESSPEGVMPAFMEEGHGPGTCTQIGQWQLLNTFRVVSDKECGNNCLDIPGSSPSPGIS